MSAIIHILPVVSVFRPWQADWREQYERECAAVAKAMVEPPPRTRPMLIKLFACQRPEGNHGQ